MCSVRGSWTDDWKLERNSFLMPMLPGPRTCAELRVVAPVSLRSDFRADVTVVPNAANPGTNERL